MHSPARQLAHSDLPDFLTDLGKEFAARPGAGSVIAGPRYLHLAARLGSAIRQGRISSGASLPAERELATMLALSRHTVRRAIEVLTADGLLSVRQGSGTFVSGRFVEPISELASFSDDMRRRGQEPGSIWIDRVLGRPTVAEALALALSLTDPVVRASRVRTANAEPIAVEVAVVNAVLLGMTADFGESLYAAIRRHGHAPVRALQRVRANVATADFARRLNIAEGAPVMDMERQSYSADGRPLEWTRSTYRGDKYEYVAEMRLAAPVDEVRPVRKAPR